MDLPKDFLDRMKEMLGGEYDDFLKEYDNEREPGLRVNTLKISVEEFLKISPFSLKNIEWCSTGFRYKKDDRPGKHPYHEAGLYYIQEPSAMAPAELCGIQPGEKVLDLCAAPGGKSTQAACKLCGEGLLISNEIHPARAKILSQNIERMGIKNAVKILSQNIERMGIKNAVVTNESPKRLSEFFPCFFDRIIVDAPCSGEGMFRKDIQSREQWSKEHVIMCAERQSEILECAAVMLKPGGTMVYSTCTFAPEENEGTINTFLNRHGDFIVERPNIADKFSCGETFLKYDERVKNTVRLWPHKISGEGHFAAVLRKSGEPFCDIIKGEQKKEKLKGLDTYFVFLDKNMSESFKTDGEIIMFGEHIYILPNGMKPLNGLKVLRAGLHMGTLKKNRFEPSHTLALSVKASDVKLSYDFKCDSDEINTYLKGGTIEVGKTGDKGWCLITVDGFSIGWGKVSGGVIKNHYPKGLRIL